MPDLAPVRSLSLPPMTADEARQVVARAPGRYFLGGKAGDVIAAGSLSPYRFRSKAFLISCVSDDDLTALHEAASAASLEVEVVRPALAIWIELARQQFSARATNATSVFMCGTGTHIVRAGGEGIILRHVSPAAGPSAVLSRLPMESSCAVVAADADVAEFTEALLAERSGSEDALWRQDSVSPSMLAARGAGDSADLEFVLSSQTANADSWLRKSGLTAAIAAVALTATALGATRQGLASDLRAVQAERSAIAAEVGRVTAERRALLARLNLVNSVDSVRGSRVPWLDVLATLSSSLPDEAHLVSLQSVGDSLVLDGAGMSASDIVDALRGVSRFRAVRARGSLFDARSNGDSLSPQFSIALILEHAVSEDSVSGAQDDLRESR